MPPRVTGPARAENSNMGSRLDCWKDIAAYLGRGERTVKRWETERGLPIHRVPGEGRATVYAYTAQLDEWLKSGKAQAPEISPEETGTDEAEAASNIAGAAPDGPVLRTLPDLGTSAARPSPKWRWLLPVCGFLLAGITVYSGAVRNAGLRFSHALPSLFSKSKVKLDGSSSSRVSDSDKSVARDFYLKGRYEWSERTPDSLHRALDDFTQAVVHDPGDAKAYVGLADTYNLLREYSTMPQTDAYLRAIAAAKRAVDLDDSLPEAHRALAFAEFYGNWDFVDGEREFHRAIELDPMDATAHRWYGNAIAVQGRFDEGLRELDKARELDPSSHSNLADKGFTLFESGKRQEGIELLKDVERSAPELRSPHAYLMRISLQQRDFPTFLAEGQKAAESSNDPVLKDRMESAKAGYARDGERGLLNDLHSKEQECYVAGKMSGVFLAQTCVAMGHRQEALQLLEQAYNRHDLEFIGITFQQDLRSLKNDPGYQTLLKKINFPPASQKASPSAPPAPAAEQLRAASDPR